MKTAYLGLGSNLGDRREHLAAAVRELNSDSTILIVQGSSLYESKPFGVIDQPDFLNMVVQVGTSLPPLEVLSACLGIEARLGRERRERWGPRTIDLDVLAYDDLSWNDGRLVLPHPRLFERSFVLTPLSEISPQLKIDGTSIRALAVTIGTEGLEKIMTWEDFSHFANLAPRPKSE